MSKAVARAILAAALAAAGLVSALAFAGVVAAAPATSSPAGATAALGVSAPVYGWVIQLRGAINRDLTSTQFAAIQKTVGATWTDTSHNAWAGIPLWRLVALVDDKNPKTFNGSLAAKGYWVQVIGLGDVPVRLSSTDKSWVGNRTAIVADRQNGTPLSFGSMSTVDPGTWVPGWPAQLVGPSLASSQTTGGIVKIVVYKHGVKPPTKPTILPSWILQVRGATSVAYSAAQFRALATHHPKTWTDASVTPNVVYAGTPLWRLVALADGGSAATLNLDWLGLGYNVDVSGMGVDALGADAPTTATFASSAIAGKSSVVIADRQNGKQLTPTQGDTVLQAGPSYLWRPTWPARLGGTGVTADQSFGGVVRVVVHKPAVPSYLTPLVLKGRRTAKVAYLNFPTTSTWDGRNIVNLLPEEQALYRGAPLYTLIGLVDDGNPRSFNVKLARKGYKIELIGRDGYTWTIQSATIIGKKHWIVASIKNEKALPYVSGDSQATEAPYRFVGSFIHPFYSKPSVKQLIEIKLIF